MKTFESSAAKRVAGSVPKWSPEALRAKQPIEFSIHQHSDDPRWSLVQRILASHSLRRSALLANFLCFVCDRYIEGKTSEINERQIGFHVFGRMEGYNAGDDNIVRNYARTLRKRLKEYFATEGVHETLILHIPRGGYVPVFVPKELAPETIEQISSPSLPLETGPESIAQSLTTAMASDSLGPVSPGEGFASVPSSGMYDSEPLEDLKAEDRDAEEHDSPEASDHLEKREDTKRFFPWNRKQLYAFAAFCGLGCSALAGYFAGAHRLPESWFHKETEAARVNRIFWSGLFEEKRDTFIVPADGGLVMLQSFVKEHVSLEDYASGSYRRESEIAKGMAELTKGTSAEDAARLVRKVEAIGNRRYTSIIDLELTSHLARLPEVVPERLMIRYARDLRIDDLRTGNVIMVGSIEADPWVDLFQQQLNFRFSHGADFGGSGTITNSHPLPGEHTTYASEANDPLLRTYGVIAYVPNLEGAGHVLLIEGVNMAGTQAAGEFLLHPEQMQSVLEHAMSRKGTIRPFEVLIQTDNIAANASRPHILSERIGGL